VEGGLERKIEALFKTGYLGPPRYLAVLAPFVKSVLEEFVPSAADASGRPASPAPTWSTAGRPGMAGRSKHSVDVIAQTNHMWSH
jgi:hypothetical protein